MTRLAACQYAMELIETWEDYARHLSSIVAEAKQKGAELLLLPEYSAMVLTGQLPRISAPICTARSRRCKA